MNFLSIIFMLGILGIVGSVLLLAVKKKKEPNEKKKALLLGALLLAAIFTPMYAKFALTADQTFMASDELGLKENFVTVEKFGISSTHSSGPGLILLMLSIIEISKISYESVAMIFNLVFAAMALLAAFLLFMKLLQNFRQAICASALLFFSSYFIWPLVEFKPQQLGFILFIVATVFFLKVFEKPSNKMLALGALLLFAFSVAHALSFMLFLAMISAMSFYFFSLKNGRKRLLVPILLWFLALVFFFSFFDMIWDVHFTIREALGIRQEFNESQYAPLVRLHVLPFNLKFSLFVFSLPLALTLVLLVAAFLLKRFRKNILFAIEKIRGFANTRKKQIFYCCILLLLLVALAQVVLHYADILWWYSGIPALFILNAANIFLLVIALHSAVETVPSGMRRGFAMPAILAAAIGLVFAASLAAGFFMRKGFENFEIRAMQYFVMFIALFAAIGILHSNEKKRIALVLLLILLFPTAMISGTRDPTFFQRNAFQTTKEVKQFTLLNEWMAKYNISPLEEICFWTCEPNNTYYYGFDDKNLSGDDSKDKLFSSEHRSLYHWNEG